MTRLSIAVLPGDGIGPEVIAEAERVLEAVSERFDVKLTLSRYAIEAVLAAGYRTNDIAGPSDGPIGTREMGERVADLVAPSRRSVVASA